MLLCILVDPMHTNWVELAVVALFTCATFSVIGCYLVYRLADSNHLLVQVGDLEHQ